MKRRKFLQKAITGSVLLAAGAFPYEALARGDVKKITILHTNDQHSRIEPFPMDGGKYQGLGGFAERAAVINNIRSQEKNVLLLDSGDIWQGTPYFNKYKGELEFMLMSEMGYAASTLGNHDFDAGVEGLAKQLPRARFPFLNCNYDFTDTALQGKIETHRVFLLDGVRIGVFGVGIELQGLVPPKLFEGVRYNDPIACANRTAAMLRHDYRCHLVICLSHLGYKYDDKKVSDMDLAYRSENIDLILGGHTHTFLHHPEEYANASGKKVIINQVGWAGIYLGRIDFYFERENRKKLLPEAPVLIRSSELQ
ncbi:MAG: metallophosphatase [Chitinophagales bacterium]|nr:metallophosphatase [Chitinophagales bacterium]MDW8419418.1 metallophosphatase [Chitinophagales bacterium]